MVLAFKEWAAIVDALGKGKQNVIIRKGGIHEDKDTFEIKGNKFLLLPTLFHQSEQNIKASWNPFLSHTRFHKEGQIAIEFFAQIVDAQQIDDYNKIKKLSPWHAWTDEIIEERFNRWEKKAHVIIVQVFQLVQPIIIEETQIPSGCKSWVELDVNVDLNGKMVVNKQII